MSAVPEPSARARILPVTPDEYFLDPCERPSLSQSIARTLITRSPAHAWTEHPRFGGIRRAPTKATDDGSIIHKLLLGKGVDVEIISGFNDFKKKAAQEARDAAKDAGKIPMLEHRFAAIETAADRLRTTIARHGIELDGESEIAFEWHEPGFEGDVLCRALMDHVILSRGRIIDLKKIVSADARTCSRHAYDYGYDIQHAAYTSAIEKLKPELAGRIEFLFVFMELEEPYAVVPAAPDGMLRELGERRWRRAVELWEKCLNADRWPSYCSSVTSLEAPTWALYQEGLA